MIVEHFLLRDYFRKPCLSKKVYIMEALLRTPGNVKLKVRGSYSGYCGDDLCPQGA